MVVVGHGVFAERGGKRGLRVRALGGHELALRYISGIFGVL
jgi:hypothetical protein